MRPNHHQFEAFAYVVREGSFSAAATRLARMFHKSAKLPPNPVAETSISPDHEIRSY